MATETLRVKNFGPIEEAHLDLRKVTVLIGEQASGKSVLAKLAAAFNDIFLEGRYLDAVWDFYNMKSFVSKDSDIRFKGRFFSQTMSGDVFEKQVAPEVLPIFQEYQTVKERWDEDMTKAVLANGERERARVNREAMRVQRKHLQDICGTAKYFPAERSLVSVLSKSIFQLVDNDIKIPKFLSDFMAEYEVSRETVSAFDVPFLNATYAFRAGRDKVIISQKREIDLSESATGFQTTIPLAVVIEALQQKGKHIFIIEEPELNLYPATQKKLVEYLVEKCTQSGNRLIITTHSPYILTALNNCIQARNVLREHPERAAEAAKIVRPESQIAYEDVMAYFVADGTAHSIMNDENRLIDGNALDDISNELSEAFDQLLDLEMEPA